MATLSASQIQDLIKVTLKELGPPKFSQIAQNLQDYEVFTKWFKKDKMVLDSGYGIQRALMTKLSGASSHVGLYEQDSVNVADVITLMDVPWRHAQTNWAFEYRETLMNRGKALIQNIIQPRRADAMISLVETLEDAAWDAPPASSDNKLPYGVKYWIVPNATTGFNGGAPSGHTTVAGVDLAANPTFKNYTAQYAAVSKDDLVSKLRTAHRKCGFRSPISLPEYRGAKGERYRLYVNNDTIQSIEDIGEAQNENLGRDIASMDGTMVFRNHPIIWVPKLDSDATDPVYGIDHSTFMPVILKGDYLRESEASKAPNQHNVYQVFVDLTYNYLCVDRRRNWVINTA